jgi:hypothetical protein
MKNVMTLIRALDFWSIREPEPPPDLRGLPRPSEMLRGLKGYEFLGELSHSDPTIHSAVQMVESMLFDYRRTDERQFYVECSDPTLRDLVEKAMLDRVIGENRFGYGIHNLEGFLRARAAAMMIYGRSYTRLGWEQKKAQEFIGP